MSQKKKINASSVIWVYFGLFFVAIETGAKKKVSKRVPIPFFLFIFTFKKNVVKKNSL